MNKFDEVFDDEFFVFKKKDKKPGNRCRDPLGVRRSEILGYERAQKGGGTILRFKGPTLQNGMSIVVAESFTMVSDLLGARKVGSVEVRRMRAKRRQLEEVGRERDRFHEIVEKYTNDV